MFEIVARVVNWVYGWSGDYAVSIGFMAVLVMALLTPLTLKSTKGMLQMQRLQPELRRIQLEHRGDRQKLNEEMMALYKENQINPVGGCLPLVIQAPVFVVLYTVLRGLTRRISDLGYASGWTIGGVDLGSLVKPPTWLRNFDPAYLSPDTDLYRSLSNTDEMRWFGMDLSESAQKVLGESFVSFIPYALLILLVAVTGFIQQRQIQGRVPKGQVNSQQQMIMKFLPIMLPIFSFTLPGGLVLYFAVSNLYRVGQQWFISRKIYGLKRGETIDVKRDREGGTVETTASVVGDATTNGGRGKGKPAELTAAKGKSKSAPASGKTTKSPPSKSSRTGGRSTKDTKPTPSVQPRGRKKKK